MASTSRTTASAGGDGDNRENVPVENALQLNPEVLQDLDMPGLEDIEAVIIVVNEPDPFWIRWSEGLTIHVVASGVVAVIAFIAGRYFPL
ncbi:MAG: hypothetical protein Q7T45_23280 [Bradyrhizobium sp.]|uniref:hypothetical protein n=1 Tax=Bradyrhizobium sp. TaxID=376 RepID=UPI0027289AB4|nr:hypothetical protein [Bradyrhizobium sp.]MDO8400741.1 hypothetical protein [Bradyrhizobium sp.]